MLLRHKLDMQRASPKSHLILVYQRYLTLHCGLNNIGFWIECIGGNTIMTENSNHIVQGEKRVKCGGKYYVVDQPMDEGSSHQEDIIVEARALVIV